jgi:Fe-S oxidoreductase
LTYCPSDADYWDAASLEREFDRVFDLCHGCRLCFNLCPGFGDLFKAVDAQGEAEAAGLTTADDDHFVDLCYQCKLCYPKCPYTPPHEWAIDVPRLALRARAVRARRDGVSLQDRFLGDTDRVGKIGTTLAPLMNTISTNRLARGVMERTVGLHRDRLLPLFASETFAQWFRKSPGPTYESLDNGKVALFHTCSVNYHDVHIGRALVRVLWHNRVHVITEEQKCCGMPHQDGGNVEATLAAARFNVDKLLPWVERGYTVVSPGPTCSYMLRQEYPVLLRSEAADKVAAKTMDACEYLMRLHQQKQLDTTFKHPLGKIAYHMPCHLKAQNIGYRSRDLLKLAGAEVTLIDRCSGMDGTWGMKKEYFELSLEVAGKLFERIEKAAPEIVATDCSLAGLQIYQGAGYAPKHPIELIASAYGLTAFEATPGEEE